MITISIANIFALYIGIVFFVIFIMLLYGGSRARALIEDKKLFSCPVCAYRYIINTTEKIHRCPQCESLNESCKL